MDSVHLHYTICCVDCRVRAELAYQWLPIRRNSVWSRREGNWMDKAEKWRGESLMAACGTLKPMSPDMSRVCLNSLRSPSLVSTFNVNSEACS